MLTTRGDGETNLYSLTAGASFAQDRGNAIINLRYDDQGGVFARDRAPNTGSDVFYYGYYYGAAFGAPYDSFVLDPAHSSYPLCDGCTPVTSLPAAAIEWCYSTGMLTFDCSNKKRVPRGALRYSGELGGCRRRRAMRLQPLTHFRQIEIPVERKSDTPTSPMT